MFATIVQPAKNKSRRQEDGPKKLDQHTRRRRSNTEGAKIASHSISTSNSADSSSVSRRSQPPRRQSFKEKAEAGLLSAIEEA